MKRRAFFAFLATAAVAACATPSVRIGPDGLPLPQVYQMPDDAVVLYNMLDALNAVRGNAGVASVRLNAQLNAAAATHSRDMAVQNRPWHFGSDGSSPIDRAQRAGYSGRLLGENISETYESELETVAAWMQQADTRDVITDPDARDLGFAFYQEETGKIWWTMVTGDGGTTGQGLPANSNS